MSRFFPLMCITPKALILNDLSSLKIFKWFLILKDINFYFYDYKKFSFAD